MFHNLERRRYLTELSVTGTASDDAIAVTVVGHTAIGLDLAVQNNGGQPITVKVNSTAVQLAAGKTIETEKILKGGVVKVRFVDLLDGDDLLSADAAVNVPMTVSGGAGSDTILAGSGDDSIDGGDAGDSLNGGKGRDTIAGGNAFDLIDGGSDNDTIYGDDATNWHVADDRQSSRIDGDYIYGEQLSGNAGDDHVYGSSGHSSTTDDGKTTVYDDYFTTLSGGDGNDTVQANSGGAEVHGDGGNDTLIAEAGTEKFDYSSATLFGGDGNDLLQSRNASNELHGEAGNDTLQGGGGPDTLQGGAGNDALVGGGGDDTYNFVDLPVGTEHDTVTELVGGGGDVLQFYYEVIPNEEPPELPVNVNLSTAAALAKQGKRLVTTGEGLQNNLENVDGTFAADTIVGNSAANVLYAGPNSYDGGNFPSYIDDTVADRLDGLGGNDTLVGNGPDTLNGGDGDDFFDAKMFVGNVPSLNGGIGHDLLQGEFTETYNSNTERSEHLHSYTLPTTIEDAVIGQGEDAALDRFEGNALPNRITVRLTYRLGHADDGYPSGSINSRSVGTVNGGAGNDTILSAPFDETVDDGFDGGRTQVFEGGEGNDLLVGTAVDRTYQDNVYLQGGPGRDTLQSAQGNVWADYSDHTISVSVDLSKKGYTGPNGDVDTFGPGVTRVLGGTGNDTLIGDGGDNVLDGGGGNDDLRGGGGVDAVSYASRTAGVTVTLDGKANDGVKGEADKIGADIEQVIGSNYNDSITGGSGNDSLRGLGGNDTIGGGEGNDTLTGDSGNDVLRGDGGNDTTQYPVYFFAFGQAHADETQYDDENRFVTVTLDGKANDKSGNFTDNVMTENVDGADAVTGDSGPNMLTHVGLGQGADIEFAVGGAGNDTLQSDFSVPLDGGGGADVIRGGYADYGNRTHGVAISPDGVANDGEPGEHDNVTVIDPYDSDGVFLILGGAGNDTLNGTDDDDLIVGLGGDDSINGLGGNDHLVGGLPSELYSDLENPSDPNVKLRTKDGNDTISGGSGDDFVDYVIRTNNLTLTLDGKNNDGAAGEKDNLAGDIETLVGGSKDDHFVGDSGDNAFIGGPGADDFHGGAGTDEVTYQDFDYYYYPLLGDLHDYVSVSIDGVPDDGGSGENDNVHTDIDRVIGGDRASVLSAGPNAATLIGYGTLTGGPGDDTLVLTNAGTAYGFGGDDTFVNQNGGLDVVDGGDGFDSVQDDDVDTSTPGLQNDDISYAEFVYDQILTDVGTVAAKPSAVAAATPAVGVVSGIAFDPKTAMLTVTGTPDADTITLGVSKGKVVATLAGTTKRYDLSSVGSVYVDAGGGKDKVTITSEIDLPSGERPRVFGGSGNDVITGGPGNDILEGGADDDRVDGGDGNDLVSGGYVILINQKVVPPDAGQPDGSDVIVGGDGATDIVTYTRRAAPVVIDLTAGTEKSLKVEADKVSGIEYVVAGQSTDTLTGGGPTVRTTLYGGPGNDTMFSGAGLDRFLGDRGNDLINPGAGDYVDTGGNDNSGDRINGTVFKRGLPHTIDGQLFRGNFQDDDLFTINNVYWKDRIDNGA